MQQLPTYSGCSGVVAWVRERFKLIIDEIIKKCCQLELSSSTPSGRVYLLTDTNLLSAVCVNSWTSKLQLLVLLQAKHPSSSPNPWRSRQLVCTVETVPVSEVRSVAQQSVSCPVCDHCQILAARKSPVAAEAYALRSVTALQMSVEARPVTGSTSRGC